MPLAAPIVRAGPGMWVGSGPWELAWDSHGKLWVSEFFDATIVRVDTVMAGGGGCSQLTLRCKNPCVEDVAVFSDGFDLRTLHSLAPGAEGPCVVRRERRNSGALGSSPTGRRRLVILPLPLAGEGLGGIAEDPATGDVWFAQFEDRSVGRLQIATGDADGILDAADNCPQAHNPQQENSDRNFVSLAAWGKAFNDATWPMSDLTGDACDADADNDGLVNSVEGWPSTACATSSASLDPLNRDTDGDLALDGSECALGSDPANGASRPSRTPVGDIDGDFLPSLFEISIGTNPLARDTDSDGLGDGVEFVHYGSNPLLADGDGDGCDDRLEAASVNGDRSVNSMDLLIIALSYGGRSSPAYVPHFDVNRDGAINPADLGLTATAYGPC